MKVIVVPVDESVAVTEQNLTFEGIQAAVGGYVQEHPDSPLFFDVWCDEDGIPKMLPPNMRVYRALGIALYGNAVLAGADFHDIEVTAEGLNLV